MHLLVAWPVILLCAWCHGSTMQHANYAGAWVTSPTDAGNISAIASACYNTSTGASLPTVDPRNMTGGLCTLCARGRVPALGAVLR